jgi:transposase-like protein
MSRLTKCDDEHVDAFVTAVVDATARGLPMEACVRRACRKAGIVQATYYNWRKRAATGEEPFAAAVARIDDARDELQLELCALSLKLAREGEKGDSVKLAGTKFALERIFPEDGPAKKLEHSGRDGGPIPVNVYADPAALARRISELAARGAPGAGPGDAGGGASAADAAGAGDDPAGD